VSVKRHLKSKLQLFQTTMEEEKRSDMSRDPCFDAIEKKITAKNGFKLKSKMSSEKVDRKRKRGEQFIAKPSRNDFGASSRNPQQGTEAGALSSKKRKKQGAHENDSTMNDPSKTSKRKRFRKSKCNAGHVVGSPDSSRKQRFRRTRLYCMADGLDERIRLPIISTRVDHYLKNIPQLMDGCDELLANTPRVFNKDSRDRILYVAQGEVGHSLSSQCDILVSDKATTCHIVAFRSKLKRNASLTSLTHIDGASYESCIRAMVAEHIIHHQGYSEEEKKSEDFSICEKIAFEIHVMGGFEDADSASLEISAWLMGLLVRIADEQKDVLKMTLKTCVISSMNDNGDECPIGRGLGIDLRSGEVFLAKVEEVVAGPAVQLRSARTLSDWQPQELSVIHSLESDRIAIQPFFYAPFDEIDELLRLRDDALLQKTSTSPYVEEPDFCRCIRSTLKYLKDVKCETVFGPGMDTPLLFERSGRWNSWKIA
jgi:hypothetical protein